MAPSVLYFILLTWPVIKKPQIGRMGIMEIIIGAIITTARH